MARNVADCALMLDAVAGPHNADPHSLSVAKPAALERLAKPFKLEGARIAWRPLLGNTHLDAETREACEAALERLAGGGALVECIDDKVEAADPTWRVLQQSNWAARFFTKLDEVKDQLDPAFVDGIRAGGAISGQQLLAATYKRTVFYRAVQGWFERHAWLATPVMARPPLAATHGVSDPIEINGQPAGDPREAWAPYLNLFNLTGHPAISVPVGFTRAGMPLALQLVGKWYADADLLALAAKLEALSALGSPIPTAVRQ
jgi:aspartyl-tRNA(Asn)/glutamyl-tRNA(Gln) amidotransferase subunit A